MPHRIRDGLIALLCAVACASIGYVTIAYPLTHNFERLRFMEGWGATLFSVSMTFTVIMAIACMVMRRYWIASLLVLPFTVCFLAVALIEDSDGQYLASPILRYLDAIFLAAAPLGMVAGLAFLAWQYGRDAALS